MLETFQCRQLAYYHISKYAISFIFMKRSLSKINFLTNFLHEFQSCMSMGFPPLDSFRDGGTFCEAMFLRSQNRAVCVLAFW